MSAGSPADAVESALTGYLHRDYAHSLAEFGAPRELPRSGAWILERVIPGFPYRDASGCYPLFCCTDWAELARDLAGLPDELVTLSVVTDPFGGYDERQLRACFPDLVGAFKQHFVVDLRSSPSSYVSAHHQRRARKALRNVRVSLSAEPATLLDDWVKLYGTLIERHDVRGIAAFSPTAFARQLTIPGIVGFRATSSEGTVGMLLWYRQGDVAYYHLGASSAAGYQLRASFALLWTAIEHFAAAGVHWLNLGAGAGLRSDAQDGLSAFKRGWATGTRTAYFCGRVCNLPRYRELLAATASGHGDFFPPYRRGEAG